MFSVFVVYRCTIMTTTLSVIVLALFFFQIFHAWLMQTVLSWLFILSTVNIVYIISIMVMVVCRRHRPHMRKIFSSITGFRVVLKVNALCFSEFVSSSYRFRYRYARDFYLSYTLTTSRWKTIWIRFRFVFFFSFSCPCLLKILIL